jgi:hypothetical protein
MDDLSKLLKTYLVTAGLAERIRLAEGIFRLTPLTTRVAIRKRCGNSENMG